MIVKTWIIDPDDQAFLEILIERIVGAPDRVEELPEMVRSRTLQLVEEIKKD